MFALSNLHIDENTEIGKGLVWNEKEEVFKASNIDDRVSINFESNGLITRAWINND